MTDLPISFSSLSTLSSLLQPLSPPFLLPAIPSAPSTYPNYLLSLCNLLIPWIASLQHSPEQRGGAGRLTEGKRSILVPEGKAFQRAIRALQRERDRLEAENEQLREEAGRPTGGEGELARSLLVNVLKKSLEGKEKLLQQRERELAELQARFEHSSLTLTELPLRPSPSMLPSYKTVAIQCGVAYFLFRPASVQTEIDTETFINHSEEKLCEMPYTSTEEGTCIETLDTLQQFDLKREGRGVESRESQTEERGREASCGTEEIQREEKAVEVGDWDRRSCEVQTDRRLGLRDKASQASSPLCLSRSSQTPRAYLCLEALPSIDMPAIHHMPWSSGTQTPQTDVSKPSALGSKQLYLERSHDRDELLQLLNSVSLPVSPQCSLRYIPKPSPAKHGRKKAENSFFPREDCGHSPTSSASHYTLDLSLLRTKLQAREPWVEAEEVRNRQREMLEKEQKVRRQELMQAGVVVRREKEGVLR